MSNIQFLKNTFHKVIGKIYTCYWLPLGRIIQDNLRHIIQSHFISHWLSENRLSHLNFHSACIYQQMNISSREIYKQRNGYFHQDKIQYNKIVDIPFLIDNIVQRIMYNGLWHRCTNYMDNHKLHRLMEVYPQYMKKCNTLDNPVHSFQGNSCKNHTNMHMLNNFQNITSKFYLWRKERSLKDMKEGIANLLNSSLLCKIHKYRWMYNLYIRLGMLYIDC